jgi:hypothetical protein
MASKACDWQAVVKGMLKAELKRRNLSYGDLADKLAAIGIEENERNISNKDRRAGGHSQPCFSSNAYKRLAARRFTRVNLDESSRE